MSRLSHKVIAVFIALLLGGMGYRLTLIPSYTTYLSQQKSSFTTLTDRRGVVVQRTRTDTQRLREEWVDIKEVSPHMVQLLLAAEDKRFLAHAGVDVLALLTSLKDRLVHGLVRGGSTIDMQVVRIMHNEKTTSTWTKLIQMLDAFLLNQRWSKSHILEAYINTVPLKGEREGFLSMSQAWWQKPLSHLSASEAALLVVLPRSPNAKTPIVINRACALRPEDCTDIKRLAQVVYRPKLTTQLAPHIQAYLPETTIQTSLDAQIQQQVHASLRTQLLELRDHQALDAAAVVLHNTTGEVLAYVGSVAAMSHAPEVDMAKAPRLAGSTLKPFLYALALEHNKLSPDSVLDDSPFTQAQAGGIYRPQNFNQHYLGPVSLAEALGGSLNIPAVRTLDLLGGAPFLSLLKQMQLVTGDHDADYYGLGLALGGVEVRLLHLSNAYRALANQGQWSAHTFVLKQTSTKKTVLSEKASLAIAHILHDRGARAHSFGFDSVLATRVPTAVKTGTSKNMRDNWCVGFSKDYTVGVWVGNADGAPMREVSGVTGAAPAWAQIIEALHEKDIGQPTPVWAREGLLVQQASLVKNQQQRILNPSTNTVYAYDPDAQAHAQKIVLRASGDAQGVHWRLNEQALAKESVHLPLPAPGQHVLSLWAGKTKLDEIRFRVAGPARL